MSLPLTPQELSGLKGASSLELGVLWGQPALGVTPTEGTQGATVGGRGFSAGKIRAQSPLSPAHFKPQAELQEAGGRESHVGLPRGHLPG